MDTKLEIIEIALLKWLLKNPQRDLRLNMVDTYFTKEALPTGKHPTTTDIRKAVWSLCRQGLIYINYSSTVFTNFEVYLTDVGRIAAQEGEYNPYHSELYLQTFKQNVPDASKTVLQYLREALFSFKSECFLASAVMLGVASEAAFLEMASSFGGWLPESEGKLFLETINSKRKIYLAKFEEFRKKIESSKNDIDAELSDGMHLTFDAVLDLLRIYRNDSGHPTGKVISKEDAFTNLQLAARFLHKLYQFKEWFENNPKTKK